MKKTLLFLFGLFFMVSGASAGGGWADCAVDLTKDGEASYSYSLGNENWADGIWVLNSSFDGYNFGTPTSLVLNGGIANAWTDDTPGYTTSSFILYYRVYKSTATPGSWSQIALDNVNLKNGNNYVFDKTTAGIDILPLATDAGIYVLEVAMSKNQFYVGGNWNSMIPGDESTPYSSAVAGYKATFTKTGSTGTPTVTGISPTSGSTAGGTSVVITGTNLTAATAVNFGGTAGSITANTATSITVTSPVGSAGTVDITVTTAGGTSATGAADQFTYVILEAQWGLAGTGGAAPSSWVSSGTLTDAMSYANGLSSGTAYIKLLSDVITTAPLNFATGKTTILDLNGSNINRGLTVETPSGHVITVIGALTLKDGSTASVSSQGKITGGYSSSIGGGAIFVNNGGFTMQGGNITGNKSTNRTAGGGALYISGSGSFTMQGGSITNNEAQYWGGGIFGSSFTMLGGSITGNKSANGGIYLTNAFTVGGTAVIDNNQTTDATPVERNVYIMANNTIIVSASAPLTTGASIGVTTASTPASGSPINITGASSADYSSYFTSDNSSYLVLNSGSGSAQVVQLAIALFPTVTSISPTSGTTAGGTTVTITGTNFLAASAVKFGSTNATGYTINSATQITATSPAGSAGSVDITVITAGGTSATSIADQFTYVAAPTITSFTPATGPVGTLVTITGTNLSTPTTFSIDGVTAIAVSNDGTTLVGMVMPGANTGTVIVTTAGGTATSAGNFTVTATPYPSSQQGSKLVGTGSTGDVWQGGSVSVSADGNTALVGGSADNSGMGAAWIYIRSGTAWTQQGNKLVGTGASGNAKQGYSVSLSADGNTAIVGGYGDNSSQGAAWVYTRSGGVWTQQDKLVGTGNSGAAWQGFSVSLSADGNTAIVGGQGDSGSLGAAWIYIRSGTAWTQQGNKLVGTGASGTASQGYSVSLSADGNTAIVGGIGDNSQQGAAWVYTRSGGVWTQQGSKLVGTGNVGNAMQGISVALSADGNTALVGGYSDNIYQGAAWVYTRTGGVWTQQNKLVGTGNSGAAMQGYSVALSADGNTALVGGDFDNSQQGAAWRYTRSGSVWTQQGSKLVGTGATGSAQQGRSVSLSANGNTAIVGGLIDNSNQGAVWVFIPVAAPTVTGIAPTSGTTGGGTTVIITGTNLTAALAVKFGSANATSYTVNSGTQITATSPAGSAGTVDITVTTAGGTSATSGADQFTYVAAPTITGISTTSGPTTGSTSVVITGTNFLAASAVKFGSTNATGYTINSATQITATSPAGSAGTVDITVTTAGGTSATSGADQFTYLANPVISVSGVTAGGLATAIVATGGDLATVTNLTVTGTIDARDFKAMRDNMPLLATLDLSGATIAAYSGTDGTVTESTTYPANEIPQRAFQTKISLASIKMPSSITAIGYAAFYNCNHLTGSLTIPSSVNSIGLHAFGNCTGLTGSLTIPSLVTSIGAFAFNNCTGLTGTLTIPTSVTSIEASAFISCSNLSSIKMDGAIPTTVGSGVFNGISRATCKLTVPTAFYLNYSVASQWKDFFFVNTPSPATLSSFSTRVGTASDSKTSSFSVSPTMLDMTITAPAGYEVRENGTATFGTSLTYTSVTGNIPTKNIEVRIASTTVAGSPAGNLTCSSNGALQKSIALTGTVFPLTPTVTTQAVTAISTTGATLNASVNANNASTTVTFEYGLTTSYGTTVTASQSPATGNTATAVSYVLSGLTPNTVYHFRVNTVNSAGTTPGNDLIFTTSYGSQVINFSSLTDKTYGDADFNPEATSATSGINPITYTSSNEAVATIVNSQIHIVGFGSTNITAKQAGNANYTAAADVTKQLIVNKRSITITADAKSKTYGDADPSLTAQVTSGTIVIGDNASGSLTRATGETATDYVISQGTYSYGSNYTETFVPAYLTIGKRAITLTAVADTKTYDGTTVSTAIPTVGALLTGDEINTAPTQAFDNASVGTTHVLTASVLTIKNSSIDVTDNYDISYVAANGNITAKALTINTPTVTLSKVYDGNTVAAVTTGTLSGIVTSDAGNVTVTAVASYDNATIGTNKTIRVVYTLGGSAAGNYSAPADYLARGAEISSGTITLEPLSNPTPNATSNDLVLSYTVVTGGPTQYQITFEAAALAVGIQNVSYTALATTGADGSITITVPEGTRPGKYKGTLQMRNDSGVESTAYDFVMTVNIPTEYIAVKYNKVLILDNSTKMFSAYQWYKDGVAIEGATKQFYSDPKGLVGTYTVKATTTDGEVLYSYPKVLNIPLTQKVTAYPSLVRANQTCTVEITDGATDLDLTGAELSVYSSQGIRVYHSTKVEKLNTIKLPTMDGMYSGHVTTANGQSFPFKVIVAN